MGIFNGDVISEKNLQDNAEYTRQIKLTFISYGSREFGNRTAPQGDGWVTRDVMPRVFFALSLLFLEGLLVFLGSFAEL